MPVLLRWFLRLWATNPIAVRLVQNGSRRPRHFYIRAAYLAVLIVVLLWMLLLKTTEGQLDYRKLASAAAISFSYVAYLQVGLICILAPVFMGGAIAQEANPRTWEVLLTTPLGALEIVLGNLLGRLFFVLALLVCSLPLFALTQYFGGVPSSAIFASYAVAGCAALLVGAIAISLSVSRLVGKRAFFVFYVAVVTYLAITLAIDAWLRGRGQGVGGTGVTWMTALNPFLALRALLNPIVYARAAEGTHTGVARWFLETPVTLWCVGSSVLSILFVMASTLTVRAGGLQSFGHENAGHPWYRRMFGLGRKLDEHRAPKAVWTNPIAWREAAARNSTFGKRLARWVFLALGTAFGATLIWLYHDRTFNVADFRFAMAATLWSELAVITLVAINTSATAISKEREDGTLDLLLTTPITASAYLMGKLRGLITYLLPLMLVPLGTLAMAAIYVVMGGIAGFPGLEVTESAGTATVTVPLMLPEGALIAPLVVIPFIASCVMIGLQFSLKSRGVLGSVVATVGAVGLVAGVIGLCSWSAGSEIPVIGPVLAAISPASMLNAILFPSAALTRSLEQSGVWTTRITLVAGSVVAALVYAAVVYGVHSNMVRTFDVTMRRLAGNK